MERHNLAEERPEILDSLLLLFSREYEVPETEGFRLKAFEAGLGNEDNF